MRTQGFAFRFIFAAIGFVAFASCGRAQTAPLTNTVTGVSGFNANYVINGQNDPALTLFRGVTYVFQLSGINTHNFWIKTTPGDGTTNAYNNGVINNGAVSGNLIFAVPTNAPSQLFYNCEQHAAMTGPLNIISPPTPPNVEIVLVTITDQGITMKSTGATNWTAIPEFSSNLAQNVWGTVPLYTNQFANGTNTTTFNRLDAICGSNVFLRVRNQRQN